VLSFVGLYVLIRIFAPGSDWDIGWGGVMILTAISALAMGLVTSLVAMERGHWQAVKVLHESERRLLHSEKMAALGHLAGNVAHEFLNCLATVMGNAQLAKNRATGTNIEPLLDEIIATAKNASRLSSQLLAFAQPRPLRKQVMEVAKCISGIEHILSKALGPGIKVVHRLNSQVGMVEVDPDLVEQAVVTIALARAEAMHGHGCLTVEVSPARLSKEESDRLQAGVRQEERHKGAFVLLSVEDTATDITHEMAPRFFEPFFMARNGGKKGGLELATAYNIIRQHGGHIELHVLEGRGTKFLINLPVVSPHA
ncbi:MAG: ATP-binding protein, partial [Kiritimatiellae bacterium]|nr:ATP-binding protein [Kiritimatiellia bacterium]